MLKTDTWDSAGCDMSRTRQSHSCSDRIVQMSAERGRAAHADIAQHLPLLVRDSMAPALKELFLMNMEDIGHFKPMSTHAVLFPP